MTDSPGICVISQPVGGTGDTAQRTLLDILSAVASVSLVAADVPDGTDSTELYEVVDIGDEGIGDSVLASALAFVRMQLRMCRVISRREEEVVLFFGTTLYLLPILWARIRGKTVVLEPRGDVPRRLRITWEQELPRPFPRILAGGLLLVEHLGYTAADEIIAYSPSMATALRLDRYDHKLHPTGARYVDTDRFDVQTPFEEREPVVGYVGRFEEGKGVRPLARAVHDLPEEITVRFVGDGPLRDELTAELTAEIERGQVEITDWVPHEQVPAELNELMLYVLSSESEGLPTTILEALACGTPAYATPVSGVPDVVRDGETGFLNPSMTPRRMARDIERILFDEPLADVSQRGRSLIEAEYSLDAAIARYSEILTDIGHPPAR